MKGSNIIMKRRIAFYAFIISFCLTSSITQAQRKNSKRQPTNIIPIELVEQIINEHGARDWVNNNYHGSPLEFSQSWDVKRVALKTKKSTEFIIRAMDSFFAGSHVGTLFLYEKNADGYRSLSEGKLDILNDATVFVGSTYTNGYPDLYEKIKGRTESKIIFDGRYYRFRK